MGLRVFEELGPPEKILAVLAVIRKPKTREEILQIAGLAGSNDVKIDTILEGFRCGTDVYQASVNDAFWNVMNINVQDVHRQVAAGLIRLLNAHGHNRRF